VKEVGKFLARKSWQKEKQRKSPSAAFRLVPSPRYFANLLERSEQHSDSWHVPCQLAATPIHAEAIPLSKENHRLSGDRLAQAGFDSLVRCKETSPLTNSVSQFMSLPSRATQGQAPSLVRPRRLLPRTARPTSDERRPGFSKDQRPRANDAVLARANDQGPATRFLTDNQVPTTIPAQSLVRCLTMAVRQLLIP
jgi:hypothetical protein